MIVIISDNSSVKQFMHSVCVALAKLRLHHSAQRDCMGEALRCTCFSVLPCVSWTGGQGSAGGRGAVSPVSPWIINRNWPKSSSSSMRGATGCSSAWTTSRRWERAGRVAAWQKEKREKRNQENLELDYFVKILKNWPVMSVLKVVSRSLWVISSDISRLSLCF